MVTGVIGAGGVYRMNVGSIAGSDMLDCELRTESNSLLEYFNLGTTENNGDIHFMSVSTLLKQQLN